MFSIAAVQCHNFNDQSHQTFNMTEKQSESQVDPVAAAAVFRFDQPEGKRPKLSINWDRCLCHGTSSSVGKMEKFTETSWQKFCQAAKCRQDDVYNC